MQAEGHQVGRYTLRNWLRTSGQRALSPAPAACVAWSTLKTKLLPYSGSFASLEEARLEVGWLEVAYCLDTYFNLDRRY